MSDEKPKQDHAKEAEHEYIRKVLSTYEGRAVLWSVLVATKWDGLSRSNNPADTEFNEGQRFVGLRLRRLIQDLDRAALHKMETEAEERKIRYARYT